MKNFWKTELSHSDKILISVIFIYRIMCTAAVSTASGVILKKKFKETVLKTIFENFKESIFRIFLRDEEIKQTSLHEHLFRDGQYSFEEDISIFLADKTDLLTLPREYYSMIF